MNTPFRKSFRRKSFRRKSFRKPCICCSRCFWVSVVTALVIALVAVFASDRREMEGTP